MGSRLNLTHLAFLFIAGHFVCDYPLQGEAVAIQKSRHVDNPLAKAVPWYYWLTAHAVMHGAAVALITGSALLGLCETAAHWLIDFGKCEKWYGIHTDQALHLACKAAWLTAAMTVLK